MSNKLINYLQDSRSELKKVSWLSRKETIKHTLVVVGISIGVAVILGLVDYIFAGILQRFLQ